MSTCFLGMVLFFYLLQRASQNTGRYNARYILFIFTIIVIVKFFGPHISTCQFPYFTLMNKKLKLTFIPIKVSQEFQNNQSNISLPFFPFIGIIFLHTCWNNFESTWLILMSNCIFSQAEQCSIILISGWSKIQSGH